MNQFDLSLSSDGRHGDVRRYFTLEEANRAIVLVRRIVGDIVAHYGKLVDLQETIEEAQKTGLYERSESAQAKLVTTAEKIQGCAEELDALGVELRDWAMGAVDFPCIADGREVYLCWRHGEHEVAYWHEADAGAESRQSIESLPADDPVGAENHQ